MELNKAVNTWLNYHDKDIYSEEEGINLINARIAIREALRSGHKLINVTDIKWQVNAMLRERQKKVDSLIKSSIAPWPEIDYIKGYMAALQTMLALIDEYSNKGGEP